MLRDVLMALGTGFIVGGVFSLFRLPIPAPSALPGVAGIIGIYLGFTLIKTIF